MPIDRKQLEQQIYSYLKSIGWTTMPVEHIDYNTLVSSLYRRAQVLELDVAAMKQIIIATIEGILRLHGHWSKMVDLLEDGVATYEVAALMDSIDAEFEQLLHIADTETQTAKERPVESGTESSPC